MSPYQPPRATLRANAHARPGFEVSPTSRFVVGHFIITLHTNNKQLRISITTQQPPSDTVSDLLDRGRSYSVTTLDTFGRSSRAHWQKKGDRLFAPVAFPSQVPDQGHNKLQQPHLTLPSAPSQRNTSPQFATSPAARAAPASAQVQ